MIPGGAPLSRAMRRTRAYLKDRRGSMAVEFAMVSAPFIFLIFSVLEVAIILMISMSLDSALDDAVRKIRTGELQTAGGATGASFKTAVCNGMNWIKTQCQANLSIDVRVYPNFAAVNPPNPVANGAFNPAVLTFNPGTAGDVVVARAYFVWPLITPLLSQGLSKLSGNRAVITSTVAFRNEPYL